MHRTRRGFGISLSNLSLKSQSGFTLIELLVVVSIIAILSFTVVTNLTSARTKARDAKRTADIQAIGQALSVIATSGEDATNSVKIQSVGPWGAAAFTTLVAGTGPLVSSSSKFLPSGGTTVQDPLPPRAYEFKNTTTGAAPGNFSNFALCAQLENPATGNAWYVNVDGSTSLQAGDAACN